MSETATELSQSEKIEVLEDFMLGQPQVECPVIHHFGPGIYIREVHLPAGIFAVGHYQKFEHLNIMLKGKVLMPDGKGGLKTLSAPLIFTGQPGRKFGYILEDVIWQNIYATDETNVDILEDTYLEKSTTWKEHDKALQEMEVLLRNDDREDYALLLDQINLTDDIVRQQSENELDQIPMPEGLDCYLTVRDSCIEGKGVFLTHPVEEGFIIAPARVGDFRTPAGRYTNHSKTPNAEFVKCNETGDIYLVALQRISGCVGSSKGEEVTVDYRQALRLSGIFIEGIK